MTTLHDQLGEATSDVHADLPALTTAARKRGLAQRRRHRALAVVGTAAAALLVGSAAFALASQPSASPPPIAIDPTPTGGAETPEPVALVPLDGRATAGLLARAVSVYGIEASSSRGQGGGDALGETYADIEIAGSPGTTVGVNVQAASITTAPDGLVFQRQDDGKIGTDRWVATYTDHGREVRISVALVVPEGNAPPLNRAQLSSIASDPVWAFEIPESAAVPAPAPYTALD